MTDLTKLTVDQLRAEILVPENGVTFELARRAQANDALRLAAQEAVYQGLTERDNGVIELTPGEPLRARLLVLRNALAAAPAPSSSGAPAPADPWTPVQCDYDRNIHANQDANAWADFFVQVHPGLADKHDLMRAWFANAMMAMHDSPRCKPAPVDRQREAAIEASPYDALGHAMEILAGTPYTGEMASKVARVLRQWSDKWAAAVDLTCPAPPAPVDQDAKLRDAVAALETVATKQQKVELRDAAHRILQGYSPCMNCGKWARRSECHWPCNPIGKAPPAPVAPVTEGEVEAAISLFGGAAIGQCDEATYNGRKDALRALIARRVAEARGAGLRDLRARLVDFCRIRDRGYDVRSDFSPLWVLDEIDRLLAAPPASKLAEEPAQEGDGPCLSALLANMRMEMSDGANGMRTPREEAIAAVVECVARRIEALENNKEAGK